MTQYYISLICPFLGGFTVTLVAVIIKHNCNSFIDL